MEIHKSTKFLGIYAVASILLRLLPHAPNIAPIGALALFAGARGKSKWGLALPLLAMAISDLFIGLYDLRLMAVVYGSFLVMGMLGRAIRKSVSAENIVIMSIVGSALFFLATNTAVWAFSPWYAKNIGGLLESLVMGLPFWRNSLIGDLSYGALFFGAYALAGCITYANKFIYNKANAKI